MLYDSLSQRIIDFNRKTFPKFQACEDVPIGLVPQQHTHGFMRNVLELLYKEPDILGFPPANDEVFKGMQKNNPLLKNNFDSIVGKLENFYKLLFEVSQIGRLDGHVFTIDRKEKRFAKTTLCLFDRLGLQVAVTSDNFQFTCDQYPELFIGLKGLSSKTGKPDRLMLYKFSRSIFDASEYFALNILKPHFRMNEYVNSYIGYLQNRGFEYAFDLSFGTQDIEISFSKKYKSKPKPLTGLNAKLTWQEPENLKYSVGILEPVKTIERFEEMDDDLKALIFQKTHKCNGCGYCIQTNKAQPLKSKRLSFGGESEVKCPMFLHSSWSIIDVGTKKQMIGLIDFNEHVLANQHFW